MTLEALEDTGCNEVAKRTAKQGAGVEDTHAEGQLLSRVPLGQVEQDTGEEGCLYRATG
jgi:hypothetical protein